MKTQTRRAAGATLLSTARHRLPGLMQCYVGVGVFLGFGLLASTHADTLDRTPIEATTVKGEKVMLYPTGKWEFANSAKAVEARKVAEQYPENKVRPVDAQGGLFGVGRQVMPGDKDYNRGSLSGK